ncbi:BamA/TamA family outer membrane protein [Rhizobacter sp. J219]|uniref:ShlB/FhaC/HecB family hemolysin secretion/activation protein n=1 Tax=Rhizobacter sp. J219 TaxID=2898430 RepID=UPI0021509EAF|nr:ShlB/FhaC/HecB family hemolysin secretion/activation protein [Rhizobacter sp. J219]MCR5881884.1 BamA/TamA family outer membrane protein [Rhizobacter sp. J219]
MPSVLAQLIRRGMQLAIASAVVSIAHAQPAAPQAEVEVARFDILEYRVLGNSVLARERVERAVAPFLGEKRTIADVEAARTALEKAYRDAGYGTVLVDTPEQRVAGGVVMLQVVEAPVTRLRVIGAKYYSQGRILEKVPALAEGQVPNFNDVGTQLGSVNRTADRRVTPLLRPGKQPGTTEVDLQVDDSAPLHGSLELNNKHGPNTTSSRLVGSLRYDNLWQREHSLGLQLQLSPQKTSEVRAISASYTVPVDSGMWVMSYVNSRSSTLIKANGLLVDGTGKIYGVRRMFFDVNERLMQSVTLSADYKDMLGITYQVDADGRLVQTRGTCSAETVCTPIRYAPLGLSYSATATRKNSSTQAGVGLTLGLRALANDESEFAVKRFGAQSNFMVLRLDLGRVQKLKSGAELSARVDGLLGNQPLISDEQFTVGGADSVRGYLESAAAGDKGIRASLEARTRNLWVRKESPAHELKAHAFLEGGGVWTKMPLVEQDRREGLLSTGVGLRLKAGRHASLSVDVALPLRDGGGTDKGSTRVHASATVEF